MCTRIFSLQTTFPELFQRAVKPVLDIPVFYDGHTISTTSLDARGEFGVSLPYKIEATVKRNRVRFSPLYQEQNRNPDPAKIRLRIIGIQLTISP